MSDANLAMWQLMAAHWKHTWLGGVLPVGDEVGLEPTHAMSVIRRDPQCTICREKVRLTDFGSQTLETKSLLPGFWDSVSPVFFSRSGSQLHGMVQPLLLVSEYLLHLPLITDPVREDCSVLFQQLLDQTTPG